MPFIMLSIMRSRLGKTLLSIEKFVELAYGVLNPFISMKAVKNILFQLENYENTVALGSNIFNDEQLKVIYSIASQCVMVGVPAVLSKRRKCFTSGIRFIRKVSN